MRPQRSKSTQRRCSNTLLTNVRSHVHSALCCHPIAFFRLRPESTSGLPKGGTGERAKGPVQAAAKVAAKIGLPRLRTVQLFRDAPHLLDDRISGWAADDYRERTASLKDLPEPLG